MLGLVLAWTLPTVLSERVWDGFAEEPSLEHRQSFLRRQALSDTALSLQDSAPQDDDSQIRWDSVAPQRAEVTTVLQPLPECVNGVLELFGTYEVALMFCKIKGLTGV
eukprot:s185_g24.t1